jgi:hypothetical protein
MTSRRAVVCFDKLPSVDLLRGKQLGGCFASFGFIIMNRLIFAAIVGSLAFFSSAFSNVTISVVGDGSGHDIIGTEAQSYRSTDVVKHFDVNGDNVYGTDGYLVFGGPDSKLTGQEFSSGKNYVVSTPSFVRTFSVDDANTIIHRTDSYDSSSYDDASLSIGVGVADFGNAALMIMNGSGARAGDWYDLLTFTVDTTVTSFRLGVMSGQDNEETGKFDTPGFALSFIDHSSNFVGPVQVTSIAATTDTIGMVFFDVTLDGKSGTFILQGQDPGVDGHPTLAGLTFDAEDSSRVGIPESSVSAIFASGLALCAAMFRRRRALGEETHSEFKIGSDRAL